jgi:DNA-binding MarR family transcriptional regulator
MSEILENLFGSKAKTRLLRFFLQNPEQEYSLSEIAKRNMLKSPAVRSELENLRKIKFVIRRTKQGKRSYILNQSFAFYPELKNLISKDNIYPQSKSLSKVKGIGNIKLAVISGAFINYSKSKADMILVGDGISRAKLRNLMNSLEAEIGKEVDFVLMSGEEFKYRLNMLDKFILEFLEGPHEEVINKITGLKRFIANRK